MEIKEALLLDAVSCLPEIKSKKRLLRQIAAVASNTYNIDYEIAYRGLLARENASSTGLGQGIALPHARSEQFPTIVCTFTRLCRPIEYRAPDRRPVDLVFGIFAPMGSSVEYLKLLSSVARNLRQEDVQRRLRSTESAEGLHLVMTENSD